ncbi:LuxR family transcriptional regulator [Paenibacillus sp. FSL R7-0273]|uniref:GIY-YIG nuclease family protein n=1 Tax=Paenibacillus sp. FSL R7-0273 TaxID=1536772 RepID=UPI0004F6BBEC|nr:GIY-YIG nuclease family protein [Paenibacillus sp. FSL R7-0273]AIQ47987.1 LuxR family transcriptional regulator [Paenibacillus sp. FSL R7-0273]OMF94464.1 LuxR family transcriptional regulator [Paenibacillus sp. FSL R7-0273]
MDKSKRKELQEEYKQIKTYMGAIQITNKVSGKIYIDSFSNLKNKWFTLQMQLDMGRFANAALQKDWTELGGAENFTYEVLEQKEADETADIKWECKQMLKQWLDKLQPYEDKGYNKPLLR